MTAMNTESNGPDPLDVAIGSRVRARRRMLGLSQTALGEELGVTFQQVQKYERGINRISGSTLIRALAENASNDEADADKEPSGSR